MEPKYLLIFILLIPIDLTYADNVCTSIDIKHEKDLKRLRDCTVVEGHVRLSNFRIFETHDIASSIEEVTDYLLVYRVEGLETLESIFPNLTIIRGHKLLFDKYSLVVYENRNLRDLSLISLLKIRSGSIQIESNPVLCFADTINWVYLMENHSIQHFSIKDNKDPNECPLCVRNETNSDVEFIKTSCWNLKSFQRRKPIPHLSDCPEECGKNGCTTDHRCCSSLCLTGCFAENCRICKNYKNLDGNCVESCNVPYYTLSDQCITESDCRKRGLIPHAGACLSVCPRSYQQAYVNDLQQCNLLCNRNFTIRFKDDLEEVKDCVIIEGSLHIELRDDRFVRIEDLENAFGGIKEITGSLKITKSPQLVTLGFFKKLDTIKGNELIDGDISFYVVDNFHLEEIWPENHKVAILNGRIFFHLNPELCYEKILQLVPSIRKYNELRPRDASHNSNGERTICGGASKIINPVVEDINATAARIKVKPLSSYDRSVVLGYMHYYKEAPIKNVTMFDGRHGCGRDIWAMDMTLNQNVRHVISNLKPFTQYAFFVKTLSMIDYHSQKEWYSPIQYFKTTAMKPGPVHKMYSIPLSSTAIIVHWWPPKDPNGVIDKYLLRYEPLRQHMNHSRFSGYSSLTKDKDCECGVPKPNRGPSPNELNYYNKDQSYYDEAVINMVYVSSKTIQKLQEARRLEDLTRRKRETTSVLGESANGTKIADSGIKKNVSAEEQAKIDNEKSLEYRYKKLLEEIELRSIREQDTGIGNFTILSPQPICAITNPSIEYQAEHNCAPLEHYEGIEIPGNMHSFTLEDLEPDVLYLISVRACVEGLENACGPQTYIEVETVSEKMESFLKGP